MAAGPIVAWIAAGLENAVIVGGLSAMGAGLFSIGIPKNSVLKYETAVKSGKFVLVAHGSPDEVTRAKNILDQTGLGGTTLHMEAELAGAAR